MRQLIIASMFFATACHSAPAPLGAGYAHEQLQGLWQPEAGGEEVRIELVKSHATVTSIVDSDGEVFQVTSSAVDGDRFRYDYFVPSTGYNVSIWIDAAVGGNLETSWSNDHDATGHETYIRRK